MRNPIANRRKTNKWITPTLSGKTPSNLIILEKAVTTDLLHNQIPELQALKLILSPSTWEQIEEMMEENPASVMQMYEKWKPHLGGAKQTQEQYMF